jgi:nucleoside-diphosphate-sugar epimerase
VNCLHSRKLSLAVTGFKGFIAQQYLGRNSASDWCECRLDDLPAETVVLHLASKASLKKGSMNVVDNNVGMDLFVAKTVEALELKLIYFSTNNIYPMKIGCTILDAQLGCEAYSNSKFIGEKVISCLDKTQFTILRLADVFGVGQRHGNFFRALQTSVSDGQLLTLYGRGQKLRSYIYIDELLRIIDHEVSMAHGGKLHGHVYNVCHPEAMNIYELVSYVSDVSGLDVIQKDEEISADKFDIRTMERSVIEGYGYQYSLAEGLEKYIQDCRRK